MLILQRRMALRLSDLRYVGVGRIRRSRLPAGHRDDNTNHPTKQGMLMQYRRNYEEGGTYFFTVNLWDRNKTLLVDYVDVLRDSVRWVKQRRPFMIDAWVVLPDHLHAVWTLPEGDADYSSRWRDIKKRFSRSLPNIEPRSAAHWRKGERGIWQRRFWEHTINTENDYRRHVDYVHINPLKHGLVGGVKDWPYSSFHRAVAQGIYDESWCGVEGDDIAVGGFGERD